MDSVHVCLYMHVHLEKHVTQRRKGRSILGREDSSVPIFKRESTCLVMPGTQGLR